MRTLTDWEITNNRYVAYIDIMGFKEMVARLPHNEIYMMMKKIESVKKCMSEVEWLSSKTDFIATTTYSDSIMIYSKDDSYAALYSLICSVSSIINELFINSIPFKGAVAYGAMTLDMIDSIFFGQPLIDAYLLQDELHFYGVVAHATIEEKIINFMESEKIFPFIKEYNCNFKNGNSKHLTIIPMYSQQLKPEFVEIHSLLHNSLKKMRFKTSGQIRRYIDNTQNYFDFIKEEATLKV
jgi:hypothetical protein